MTDYKKVYLDTSPFIYYLQESKTYYDTMTCIFEEFATAETEIYTSDLTIEEYCVYPYRENRPDLIDKLDAFIDLADIKVTPTSGAIAKKAAKIRADYSSFKGMDALHLATAAFVGCDLFLTNDKQLRQFSEIKVLTIDDINSNSSFSFFRN